MLGSADQFPGARGDRISARTAGSPMGPLPPTSCSASPEMLRGRGVVGRFVEFFGPGTAGPFTGRPGDAREHVARVRIHLRDLPDRRRDAGVPSVQRTRTPNHVALVEAYARESGLFHDAGLARGRLHRHPRTRSRNRGTEHRGAEAPAAANPAVRREASVRAGCRSSADQRNGDSGSAAADGGMERAPPGPPSCAVPGGWQNRWTESRWRSR